MHLCCQMSQGRWQQSQERAVHHSPWLCLLPSRKEEKLELKGNRTDLTNRELEMLSTDIWLGLTMVLPQISWAEPQKILRIVTALRFRASPKPPRFNIRALSARLQTNTNTSASAAGKKSKNQTTAGVLLCQEALTRSRKLAELAPGRGTHLYRALVAHPQLHIAVRREQRSLPPSLRQDEESLSTLERENTKRRKKLSEVWLHNILDPWSTPSLLTTTKSLQRHGDTPLMRKKMVSQVGRVELCCSQGKAAPLPK